MSALPPPARAPLRRWRDRVAAARYPRSAREYVDVLYDELVTAAGSELPLREQLAAAWRAETGTDRRGRALRILDRLGELEPALDALDEARRIAHGAPPEG